MYENTQIIFTDTLPLNLEIWQFSHPFMRKEHFWRGWDHLSLLVTGFWELRSWDGLGNYLVAQTAILIRAWWGYETWWDDRCGQNYALRGDGKVSKTHESHLSLSVALPTSSWSCQGPPGAKGGLNLCDWTGKAHVLILDQANPYEDLALCLLKTQLSDCYHRYPPPHLHHHRRLVETNLLRAYHLQGAIVSTSHASWHFELLVTPWSNIQFHAKSWSEQGSAHNKSSRKNN